MEKEFIPYEQALALKELGFDKLCFGYCLMSFKKDIVKEGINGCVNSALESHEVALPLYQQAFAWFRDKHKLHCSPEYVLTGQSKGIRFQINYYSDITILSKWRDKYEEAELECIKKLIEIVKEKK